MQCASFTPPMPLPIRVQLLSLCRDVLAPLLAVDGGVLYVVVLDDTSLVLHLGGTCAGCPGAPITTSQVIEPAVRSVSPSVKLSVTSGGILPPGAVPATEFSL